MGSLPTKVIFEGISACHNIFAQGNTCDEKLVPNLEKEEGVVTVLAHFIAMTPTKLNYLVLCKHETVGIVEQSKHFEECCVISHLIESDRGRFSCFALLVHFRILELRIEIVLVEYVLCFSKCLCAVSGTNDDLFLGIEMNEK